MIEVVLSDMEPETASPTQMAIPFWQLHLCVTLPWFSTYTSRGPWNGCSGHLPQPQPLHLSIACLEGSCQLTPWVLCLPPEQKIYLAWRGWTQLSLILWLPLHRHPWVRVMLECTPNIIQVSHSPSPPTILKTPDAAIISPSP